MLAPQLVGRLLSEIDSNENIRSLLRQCDEEGSKQNALVPTNHCMHTPGGPLKYSLEGHRFAVFSIKLTSDYRYVVSVSNKFITWDVYTSDLARTVQPRVEGLMMDLQISPENKFAAAYTNNNQIILLNTLISEYVIIDSPLEVDETVQGIYLLDTVLIIYGQRTWSAFDMTGKMIEKKSVMRTDLILSIVMDTREDFSIISWSGNIKNPAMAIQTYKLDPANGKSKIGQVLEFNHVIAINKNQNMCWVCPIEDSHNISMFAFRDKCWWREKDYPNNPHHLLMLACSQDEKFIVGTFLQGFVLWNIDVIGRHSGGKGQFKSIIKKVDHNNSMLYHNIKKRF